MKTKKCTKCGIEKPLTEFHKDNRAKDRRMSQCKESKVKQQAEYSSRPEVKERRSEYYAGYYFKNKEKISEQKAGYRSRPEVKEKISEQKAQYYVEKKAEQPSCTYQIKNLTNNKVYIGETIRGELRWKQHLSRLRGGYHTNKLLQEEFNKYGEEAFEWSILKEFESENKDALLLEEARTIQQYIQDGVELYNLALTVEQLKMLEEDKDIE